MRIDVVNTWLIVFTGLLLAGSGISIGIAALVYGGRRDTLWARPFTLLALASALFMSSYAFELNSPSLSYKLIWGYAQYLCTTTIPVFYFLFALNYTDHPLAISRKTGLFFVIPCLTLAFLWFDIGNLVYASVTLQPSPLGPNVNADYGWWFWVHAAYSYLLLGAGALVLLNQVRHLSQRLQRLHLSILTGCIVLPLVGNVMTVLDIIEVDLTPFLLGGMSMVMAFALYHLRLFDIKPARMAVVERMDDGFLSLDPDNRLVDFNLSLQDILGKTAGELRNRNLDSLGVLDQATIDHLRDPDFTGRLETTLQTEGTPCHYALYVSSLTHSHDARRGRLILFRDITQRRQLEQLQEDLTRAMVHDLRSPISTAIQLVDLLVEEWRAGTAPSSWGNEILDRTQRVLRSAIHLIEQTLELQRMENGQLDLQVEELSIAELMRYVEPMVRPSSQQKQIKLITNLSPLLPNVLVDRLAIARVLQNLFDNGIKFTPSGGKIILNASTEEAGDQTHLLVSLRDSGPGIPEELRPQLFEKFARGNQPERGFCLGLACCKTSLAAHGEKIWLADSTTTGTTFAFTLPAAPRRLPPI